MIAPRLSEASELSIRSGKHSASVLLLSFIYDMRDMSQDQEFLMSEAMFA